MDLTTTLNTVTAFWHPLLAQTPAVSDLMLELEALKSQVEPSSKPISYSAMG